MTHVITEACRGTRDKSCVTVCPVDCIHGAEDGEQMFINPSLCIDCGACAGICPVSAIYIDSDLPEHLAKYRKLNADFFATLPELADARTPE